MINKPTIYLFDRTFTRIALIDDYESVSWTRNAYRSGDNTISINYNTSNAHLFQKGLFVRFGDDDRDFGIITNITDKISETGKGSQQRVITVKDARFIFHQRVISDFNENGDYNSWKMKSDGGNIMRELISSQCGNTCNANRKFDNLLLFSRLDGDILRIEDDNSKIVGTTLNLNGDEYSIIGDTLYINRSDYGRTIEVSYAGTNLYDALCEIAEKCEVCWSIYFNEDGKTLILVFENSTDKSNNVFMTTDYDAIKSGEFKSGIDSYANFVTAGGYGSGKDRLYSTGYTGANEPSGYDRYEAFTNNPSQIDVAGLQESIGGTLAQYSQTDTITGVGLAKSPYVYKKDYDVFDKVTVGFSGHKVAVKIISVSEVWAYNSYAISYEFGKPSKGLTDQLINMNIRTMNESTQSTSGTNTNNMTDGVKFIDIANGDVEIELSDAIYNVIAIKNSGVAVTSTHRKITFKYNSAGIGCKQYYIYDMGESAGTPLDLTTDKNTINIGLKGAKNYTIIRIDTDGYICEV